MALLLITVIVDYVAMLIVMKMTTILPEEMILVMAIMKFQMILFLVLEREGEIQQVCVFQFNVQPVTWFVNMLFLIIIYTKKLLNSDWLRKECSSSVTRVQNV